METKNTTYHALWGVLMAVIVLTAQVSGRALQTGDYESTELSDDQEVVDELQSFLPVRDPAASSPSSSSSTEAPSNIDLCATIFCGNGRTCVIKDGGPTCGCALTCPDHYRPICGSDGVTYGNPCELHRAACLQNVRIHKHLRGPCPGPPPTPEPVVEEEQKPLVCYEIERDQLRQLLIDWMKGRVDHDNDNNPDKSYAHVLTDNFRECDQDGDDQLSGAEFMQCVEKNQTVLEFTGMRPEHGQVMRGLCVDALILMSDTNEDWMLDLEEFLRCMDPNFEPPRKQCSLENKLYEDGAETRVDCNICVCACGNWVCSAMSCEDIENYNLFEPYDVEQGPLPSKEERYALLRGFMAAEHVNLDRLDEEVPPPDSDNLHRGFPHAAQNLLHQDTDEAAPSPAETPDTVPERLTHHTLLPAYDALDNLYPDRLAGVSHELASEEDEDDEEDQEWEINHEEVSLGEEEEEEEEESEQEEVTHHHHAQPEVQPSLTNHAVVGGLPLSPPEASHEADEDEALAEYLAPESSTVHPRTTLAPAHVDDVDADVETHTESAAPTAKQAPVKVPEPVVEEVVEEEVVTPQPTPAPTPARRFIPIVNFNITVAEHRIIHTGDSPQQAQEHRVATEPILEPQHGSRHDNHNGHLHSSTKHHNNHHHSGTNHHNANHHHAHHNTNQHNVDTNNQQPQGHNQDAPPQQQPYHQEAPPQERPVHHSA